MQTNLSCKLHFAGDEVQLSVTCLFAWVPVLPTKQKQRQHQASCYQKTKFCLTEDWRKNYTPIPHNNMFCLPDHVVKIAERWYVL